MTTRSTDDWATTRLAGANGLDSLYGGGGNDTLNAVDGASDTANSCDLTLSAGGDAGPGGADQARLDLDVVGDTAHPDCETVARHADSGGGATSP